MATRLLTVFDALYDLHGRQHWWPGSSPFEVMVGAVLTQNTAWSNVERALANLNAVDALDPQRILDLDEAALARHLRPAGYFNVKARRLRNFCRWYIGRGGYHAVSEMKTGALRTELLSVNGVGPETADDILLYAFDRPVFVIDAYTRRIFGRLGHGQAQQPYDDFRLYVEDRLASESSSASSRRPAHARTRRGLYNEFHALIVIHGKLVCRTRPLCPQCPLVRRCPIGRKAEHAIR